MNALQRLLSAVSEKMSILDGMSRADHAKWAEADSLAAVGELTAQWLEGTVQSRPGYYGPVDVDEDIAPGMTDALIALNRAGFVTTQSQAGFSNGTTTQRAAVKGFCTYLAWQRIDEALANTAILVTEIAPGWEPEAPVTFVGDEVVSDFGTHMPDKHVRDSWIGYGICQPSAQDELINARQIVIRDIALDNNRMWALLKAAAEQL